MIQMRMEEGLSNWFILYSLLHWACDRGDLTVVKELMERKADYSKKDDDDFLPLDYACVCEHYEIIDCLVENMWFVWLLEGTWG